MKLHLWMMVLVLAAPAGFAGRAHAQTEDPNWPKEWICTYTTRTDQTPHTAHWKISGPFLVDLAAKDEGGALKAIHERQWRISVNNEITVVARFDEDTLTATEDPKNGAVEIDRKTGLYSLTEGSTAYVVGHDTNARHEETGMCKPVN
jgi:hypothetical protein